MTKPVALSASAIVLVGILAYANSLSGPLLFDDQSAITLNPQIRHLWPIVEPLAPPTNSVLASRPIVNLSFAVNYAIGGLSVRGYHVANVAIHLLSALVLFGILRRTLDSEKLRAYAGQSGTDLALACALIWMVHPLLTESVNYVTQRTELMMGLFYLLTLYCSIRAAHSPTTWWRVGAICSALVGTGCKESMATVPLVVMLYDRIFLFDSWQSAFRRRAVLYAGLALSWAMLLALLSSRTNTVGFNTGISVWQYLLNQALMVGRYLKLAIWPRDLVMDYGVPRILVLPDVLPQALLIVALLLLTVTALIRRPMVGFLGSWFFITLAPTSSFVPIATEMGAERRMYLPLAALVVFGVMALRPLRRRVFYGLVALIAIALAVGTIKRNNDYASGVALLQTSVDRWPQGRARFNLAVVLKAEGRFHEAEAQLRAAVVDNPQAQYVLASGLYARGEFVAAFNELRAFLARNPPNQTDVSKARNLLALCLAEQGRRAAAIDELQRALTMDPNNPDLHGNLAVISLQERRFESARRHYEAYLSLRPATTFVLTGLGTALRELGRRDEARARFREALALDPNDAEARAKLSGLP